MFVQTAVTSTRHPRFVQTRNTSGANACGQQTLLEVTRVTRVMSTRHPLHAEINKGHQKLTNVQGGSCREIVLLEEAEIIQPHQYYEAVGMKTQI